MNRDVLGQPDDLLANQQGYLSETQRKKLRKEISRQLQTFIVVIVLIVIACYAFPILTVIRLPLVLPNGGLNLLTLFLLTLAISYAIVLAALLRRVLIMFHDLRMGHAVALEGRANTSWTVYLGRHSSIHHWLRIGHIHFSITREQFNILQNGEYYKVYYAPHSKLFLTAEHLADTSIRDYREAVKQLQPDPILTQVLNFNEADLLTNRNGVITSAQVKRLRARRLRLSAAFVAMIVIGPALCIVWGIVLFNIIIRTQPLFFLIFQLLWGIVLEPILRSILMTRKMIKSLGKDLKAGEIRIVWGEVTRRKRRKGLLSRWRRKSLLEIDGLSFEIPRTAARVFVEGASYGIYYTPHAMRLLSADDLNSLIGRT